MATKLSGRRRGQVFTMIVLILIILIAVVAVAHLVSRRSIVPSVQGQPTKDPTTGLYPVFLVVSGHRDLTIFHMNFHANVHLDFVTYYFTSPSTPPSGQSWIDFGKPIHVVVTITGSNSASTFMNTFDMSVSIGVHWGRILTYNLTSGSYIIDAQGVDQDGFRSSSTTQLVLP
jgi:hypothetical protein